MSPFEVMPLILLCIVAVITFFCSEGGTQLQVFLQKMNEKYWLKLAKAGEENVDKEKGKAKGKF
jgi:hypothetical protein